MGVLVIVFQKPIETNGVLFQHQLGTSQCVLLHRRLLLQSDKATQK
jgi:hypothetical protein